VDTVSQTLFQILLGFETNLPPPPPLDNNFEDAYTEHECVRIASRATILRCLLASGCTSVCLFWMHLEELRGWDFGLGAVKRQKSFPPEPLTTQKERNDAQARRLWSRRALCLTNSRDLNWSSSGIFSRKGVFLATFRTGFSWIALDWKKIRSEASLKKSNPKRHHDC
jgi:hypothetical protein